MNNNKGIPLGKCKCSVCGEMKFNIEYSFYKSRYTDDGYRLRVNTNCRSCRKRLSKELSEVKKNAPPQPDWGDLCQCCKEPVYKLKDGQKDSWQCDHKHGTTEFRGWICKKCNTGLGLIGDSATNLLNMYSYLIGANNFESGINEYLKSLNE